jgi:hypothetical protein
MGSFPLYGLDRTSWDKIHERDLVTLWPRKASDPFSQWFTHTVMPFFHHLVGVKFRRSVSKDLGDELYEYSDATLRMIARATSTVIASILPLLSVVGLYFVKATGLRLGIIVLLSACFSLALSLMTNARKIELFAATSA